MSEITEGIYLPASPYPGIKPFTYAYRNAFFAREEESRALLQLVVVYRGVLLYSESGVGKSSLVNAGLIPRIIAQGYQPERLRVQPEKGQEIIVERLTVEATEEAECLPSLFAEEQREQELVSSENAAPSDDVGSSEAEELTEEVALSVEAFTEVVRRNADAVQPLLIFDQFEEWTTLFEEGHSEYSAVELRQMQQAILEALVALLNDRKLPVKLLIVLREDYLAQLTPLFERCPTLVDQYLRLTPLDGEQVLRTIRGPFDEFPGHYQPEISADLARTIREQFEERSQGANIRLTEVQIVCESLSKSPDPDRTFARYADEKGSDPDPKSAGYRNVQGLLEEYLEGALESLPLLEQLPAVVLLTRMVTTAGTRKRISHEDLLAQMKEEEFQQEIVAAALHSLEHKARLVRRESLRKIPYYEIASEFLVSWIRRQAEAQRLQKAALEAKNRAEEEARRLQEEAKKAAAAALRKEKQEAQKRELAQTKESNRRMRRLATFLVIVSAVAVMLAVIALQQTRKAFKSAEDARSALQTSESALLSAKAADKAAEVWQAGAEANATVAATSQQGADVAGTVAATSQTAAATSQQGADVAGTAAAQNQTAADAAETLAAEKQQVARDSLGTREALLVSQLQPTATATAVIRPGTPTPTQAGVPTPTATLHPTATPSPTMDTQGTATAQAALATELANVRATGTAVAVQPLLGEGLTQMTSHEAHEYVPSLSPDQRTLLIESNRTGLWQIWALDLDEGTWIHLRQFDINNHQPRFSPDGQRIVFSSKVTGDQEIFAMSPDDATSWQLTSSTLADSYPTYSSDGQSILFMSRRSGSWGVYIMNADGSGVRPVVDTENDETFPYLSPDGRTVVFQADYAGDWDIYTVPTAGGEPVRLTYSRARDATPVFTPDGRSIVFETNRDGDYEIYAMAIDGTYLRNLTNAPDSPERVPSVSPDGLWVLFQSKRFGSWDIFRLPLTE